MPFSKIDVIYRSLLLTKYFIKGWGNPDVLKKLLKFRKIVSKRGECYKLVPDYYPVNITKENVLNNMRVLEGYFITPFDMYFPDLLPPETKKAHFQMILPLNWKSNSYKPVCLHMAGTGDHYFWRRRQLMAKPLLYEGGVGSIILENPFYGSRKPSMQVRSILHNVTDIFVMGGCLMMEAIVLFHWCQRSGLGPLGVTGISMGGHMASLAAASWPFPIVLVPCLSWSTASAVFTEGVMSRAINWDLLRNQIENTNSYELPQEIEDQFYASDSLDDNSRFTEVISDNNTVERSNDESQLIRNLSLSEGTIIKDNMRRLLFNRIFDRNKINSLENLPNKLLGLTEKIYKGNSQKSKNYQEALNFMRTIMDECTHLRNFPVPNDTSLVICLCALNDGYVPREGVADLSHIWPGVEIRYLQGGHISAFIFHQKAFRKAIIEGFQRYQNKYL